MKNKIYTIEEVAYCILNFTLFIFTSKANDLV